MWGTLGSPGWDGGAAPFAAVWGKNISRPSLAGDVRWTSPGTCLGKASIVRFGRCRDDGPSNLRGGGISWVGVSGWSQQVGLVDPQLCMRVQSSTPIDNT